MPVVPHVMESACMRIHVHVCVRPCVQVQKTIVVVSLVCALHAHMCVHAYADACVRVCMHSRMRACVHVSVCMYAGVYVRASARVDVCMRA